MWSDVVYVLTIIMLWSYLWSHFKLNLWVRYKKNHFLKILDSRIFNTLLVNKGESLFSRPLPIFCLSHYISRQTPSAIHSIYILGKVLLLFLQLGIEFSKVNALFHASYVTVMHVETSYCHVGYTHITCHMIIIVE